jgi:hypothetical protein
MKPYCTRTVCARQRRLPGSGSTERPKDPLKHRQEVQSALSPDFAMYRTITAHPVLLSLSLCSCHSRRQRTPTTDPVTHPSLSPVCRAMSPMARPETGLAGLDGLDGPDYLIVRDNAEPGPNQRVHVSTPPPRRGGGTRGEQGGRASRTECPPRVSLFVRAAHPHASHCAAKRRCDARPRPRRPSSVVMTPPLQHLVNHSLRPSDPCSFFAALKHSITVYRRWVLIRLPNRFSPPPKTSRWRCINPLYRLPSHSLPGLRATTTPTPTPTPTSDPHSSLISTTLFPLRPSTITPR